MEYELDFLEELSLTYYSAWALLEGRYAFNNEQYMIELDRKLAVEMDAADDEIEEILAEVKKLRAQTKAEIKSSSGPVSLRIPLSAIERDPEVYSYDHNKIDWLPDRLIRVLEYKGKDDIRREFLPIRLYKHEERYFIIDGYHRWKAYERRRRLIDQGRWDGRHPATEVERTTIPAIVFPMPKRKPRKGQYLLRTYELQGKDIRGAVEEICREKVGLPWGRIATLLKIDPQTAKKYAEPIIKAWEIERKMFMRQLKGRGLTEKAIEAECILRWPWGYGISQASVSRSTKPRRP